MRLKGLSVAGGSAVAILAIAATPGNITGDAGATSARAQAPTASTVQVVLKEWSLKPSRTSVPAGKVTFVVRNAGSMEHELVVVRTNRAPRALPMKGAQASEAGVKGKIEEFEPGLTKRLTLTLEPGTYVLLCNLPGHYKRGQAVRFVVTKGPTAAQATKVDVSAFEMGFKLSRTTVPRGTVRFDVTNDGRVPHDFSFAGRGGSPMLDADERATITVAFPKPGSYSFVCTVEGHAAAGMLGKLVVT